MQFLKKSTFWWHVLGWIIFIFLPLFFFLITDQFHFESFKALIASRIISCFVLMCIFYTNLNVLIPNFLKKEKVVLSVSILAISLILLIVLDKILPNNISPARATLPPLMQPSMTYMRPPLPRDRTGLPRLLGIILSFSIVVGVSSGIALQRDRRRQNDEKQDIALEKMAAELAVLKLQISPHFLFNTLNNIRWLARQKSELTEDAIVKLSQLLRYILYQATNEKVPLEQEINHLKNFIDLQKMRLTQPDCVQFTCEGDIKGRMIEPLLFIPFVENAFKYGVHGQKSTDIVFKIKVEGDSLIFESENTFFDEIMPKENDDSGIGIVNVQKRLALHYLNRHELRLNTEGGLFHVFLKLTN